MFHTPVPLHAVLSLMGSCFESHRSLVAGGQLHWCALKFSVAFLVVAAHVCSLPVLTKGELGGSGSSSSGSNNSCLSQCGGVVVPYPSGDFQVTVISNNNLWINTTSVKALPCSGSTNLGHAEFNLAPPPSPYVLTDQNVFFGAGCNATVNVTFDGSGNSEQTCKTGCNKPVGYPYPYCDNCCTIPVPQGTRTVDFYGGVLGNNAAAAADQAGTSSCGFSTFLQKNSYTRLS